MKIAVINGPNLDKLGSRQPEIYGAQTYADLEAKLMKLSHDTNTTITCQQSNSEGEMITWIGELSMQGVDGLVLNAAGYSHTSIALQDAIVAADVPTVEVHISNIFARESFRHQSYISSVALAVISGCGLQGYEMAIQHLLQTRTQ